jgi:hypothetical protein
METTIRATPENAPLMRKVIAEWPELNNCIDSLRQQGVFPGLRVMSITVPEGCTLDDLIKPHDASTEQNKGSPNE